MYASNEGCMLHVYLDKSTAAHKAKKLKVQLCILLTQWPDLTCQLYYAHGLNPVISHNVSQCYSSDRNSEYWNNFQTLWCKKSKLVLQFRLESCPLSRITGKSELIEEPAKSTQRGQRFTQGYVQTKLVIGRGKSGLLSLSFSLSLPHPLTSYTHTHTHTHTYTYYTYTHTLTRTHTHTTGSVWRNYSVLTSCLPPTYTNHLL